MTADASGDHRISAGRVRGLVYLLVLLLNLVQQPGRITFDTKLDLQVSPGDFLARSLHLWNPASALGELQNQAYGYLFPLGPAYLVGHVLGVPPWVWERAFSALLMVLACEGMRRVARAWGELSDRGAFAAGLFYMLAPRLLSTVGALTGETLPTAVLPWALLPLVHVLRGRMPVRRGLLLSVATIPLMGGQNATEVLSALVLPAVVLLVNEHPWRRRLQLLGGWTAGAVVVSLWWLVPLLMLGRYGSPFLEYVESARTTTDRIGWLAAVRGTDHWVTFLALGDSSSWRAGLELTSSRLLLVTTVAAATIGLLGLTSSRLPRRRGLVVAMAVGLFALTAGSTGPAGSLLDGPWTSLLDGALAPFRNVHKFDPVLRLPLALGFAAAVDTVTRALRGRRTRWQQVRPVRPGLAVSLLLVPVVLAGVPLVQGDLRDSSGFRSIPKSWEDAAAYLDSRPGVVRSLVVPGSGFAIQTWGRTTDEPLQVLSAGQWSARTQTPLMPAGTIRWLDQIEAAIESGRPDPTFAEVLGRAGITHLVVRNDLDYGNTDSPPPEVVHRVLDNSPGLLNVAHFGKSATVYPAVEIYAVAKAEPDPRAQLYPASTSARVVGGSEAMGQLLADGVLHDRAMLRARGRDSVGADVLTDTMQRVERNFGRVHDATSQVMTSTDRFRTRRAAHDFMYEHPGGSTVAHYNGITSVLASSSSGYADTLGPVLPEQGPYAAVDGSLLTSWRSAPFADPRGAWIELQFAKPTVVGPVSLQFDLQNGAGVRRIAVDTDGGRRVASVNVAGQVRGLAIQATPTRRIRFTVLDSNRSIRPVVLQEISTGGIAISRALDVPGVANARSTMSFRSTVQRPACVPYYAGLNCSARYQRLSVDTPNWSRRVNLAQGGSWRLTGLAVAAGGEATDSLLAPLDPRRVRVSASSWFGGDPSAAPQNAFDGQPTTTWVSATSDRVPVLVLRWKKPRVITRIRPQLAEGVPGRLPDRIRVESDGPTQVVTLGRFATGSIQPVRTTYLRLTLLREGVSPEVDPNGRSLDPIAISDLGVDGLEGLSYHAKASMKTGSVCGFGPQVTVDGHDVPTRVEGTIGDVVNGTPLALEACGAAADGVSLSPGTVTISVHNAGAFALRDLTLTPATQSRSTVTAGAARVESWGSARRTIRVAAPQEALLAVTQSINPGWVARLDGKVLAPVELDGWMQGWRLPSGARGLVHLTYEPQQPYLIGLLGGLALALLWMLLAVRTLVRPPRVAARAIATARPRRGEAAIGRPGMLAALVLLGLLSVPALLGGLLSLSARRAPSWAVAATVGLLSCGAVLVTMPRLGSSLVAPAAADVLVAVAAGVVIIRALATADRREDARTVRGDDR